MKHHISTFVIMAAIAAASSTFSPSQAHAFGSLEEIFDSVKKNGGNLLDPDTNRQLTHIVMRDAAIDRQARKKEQEKQRSNKGKDSATLLFTCQLKSKGSNSFRGKSNNKYWLETREVPANMRMLSWEEKAAGWDKMPRGYKRIVGEEGCGPNATSNVLPGRGTIYNVYRHGRLGPEFIRVMR